MHMESLEDDISEGHMIIVGEVKRNERSFSVRLCNPFFDKERDLCEKTHDLCTVYAKSLCVTFFSQNHVAHFKTKFTFLVARIVRYDVNAPFWHGMSGRVLSVHWWECSPSIFSPCTKP